MYLTRLELENFRNYVRADLPLGRGVTLIWGANGHGKTTLLEAVHYLSRAASPLGAPTPELIRWAALEDPLPYARLRAELHTRRNQTIVEAVVQQEHRPGGTRIRRRLKLDGLPRRVQDWRGLLQAVLFAPQDLEILSGPPSRRRRFLDETLAQLEPPLTAIQRRYAHALRQRNHLLKRLRAGRDDPRQLGHWDALLTQAGVLIIQHRLQLTARLAAFGGQLHEQLAPPEQRFTLRYRSSFALPPWQSRLAEDAPTPDLSHLTQTFLETLDRRRPVEVARAVTLTGPHRDDLACLLDDRDLTRFGSRGQQRTAALTLKLAEATLLAQAAGEPPVLLLDDVFSELDETRRRLLLERLPSWEQVLITTTDFSGLETTFVGQSARVRVEEGRLTLAG